MNIFNGRQGKADFAKIIDMAVREGFSAAAIIKSNQIIFDPSFRPYCEENLCGHYEANYSCPPLCGTPEEMKQKILNYEKALVLQTLWPIPDFRDNNLIKSAKQSHVAYSFKLIEKLEEEGFSGLLVAASGCSLCTPCAIKQGKACRFPQKQYSCMSAYCIYVKDLAEKCGMVYDYKKGLLPLFGLYAFHEVRGRNNLKKRRGIE